MKSEAQIRLAALKLFALSVIFMDAGDEEMAGIIHHEAQMLAWTIGTIPIGPNSIDPGKWVEKTLAKATRELERFGIEPTEERIQSWLESRRAINAAAPPGGER